MHELTVLCVCRWQPILLRVMACSLHMTGWFSCVPWWAASSLGWDAPHPSSLGTTLIMLSSLLPGRPRESLAAHQGWLLTGSVLKPSAASFMRQHCNLTETVWASNRMQTRSHKLLVLHAGTNGLAFIQTAGTGGEGYYTFLVSEDKYCLPVMPRCYYRNIRVLLPISDLCYTVLQAMYSTTLLRLAPSPTTSLSSTRHGQQMLSSG